MFFELLQYYLLRPWRLKEVRILFDFRRERERHAGVPVDNLDEAQYEWGAKASGVSPEKVRAIVRKWIYERPLSFLRSCRRQGIVEFISKLHERGIATAIFSDYPAKEKITALELPEMPIFASTDKTINRLKPAPTGLLVIADQLKIPVEQCLFIGDRGDRDLTCAENAGMRFLMVSSESSFRDFLFFFR